MRDPGRVAVAGTSWTTGLRWRDRRGRGHDSRMKDWLAWHAAYDDLSSALSARLRCVRSYLSDAVDQAPACEDVSLCAACSPAGRARHQAAFATAEVQ